MGIVTNLEEVGFSCLQWTFKVFHFFSLRVCRVKEVHHALFQLELVQKHMKLKTCIISKMTMVMWHSKKMNRPKVYCNSRGVMRLLTSTTHSNKTHFISKNSQDTGFFLCTSRNMKMILCCWHALLVLKS